MKGCDRNSSASVEPRVRQNTSASARPNPADSSRGSTVSHSVTTTSTVTTAEPLPSPEETCRRYEELLSRLVAQAIEQQQEIQSLKSQLLQEKQQQPHQTESSRADTHESLQDVITRVTEAVAQQYLDASDAYLAECMARRLRRITRAHVRNSIDNAFMKERVRMAWDGRDAASSPALHDGVTGRGSRVVPPSGAPATPSKADSVSSTSPSTTDSPDVSVIRKASGSSPPEDTLPTNRSADSVKGAAESCETVAQCLNSRTTAPYASTLSIATPALSATSASASLSSFTEDTRSSFDADSGDDAMAYLLSVFSGMGSSGKGTSPRKVRTPKRGNAMRNDGSTPAASIHECPGGKLGVHASRSGHSSRGSGLAGQTQLSSSASSLLAPQPLAQFGCERTSTQVSASWQMGTVGAFERPGATQTASEDLDRLICLFTKLQ